LCLLAILGSADRPLRRPALLGLIRGMEVYQEAVKPTIAARPEFRRLTQTDWRRPGSTGGMASGTPRTRPGTGSESRPGSPHACLDNRTSVL
jgi:hypothetical protein